MELRHPWVFPSTCASLPMSLGAPTSSVRANISGETVSVTLSLFRWLAETACFSRNMLVSAKILLPSPSLLTSLFRSFTFAGKYHLNNKCCWRGGSCAKQYLSAETASIGRNSLFHPNFIICRISATLFWPNFGIGQKIKKSVSVEHYF